MLVQLLYFPDCPNVAAARRILDEALGKLEAPVTVAEIDVTAPDAPAELRSWGSPTILIDGTDVAGERASGSCCRLYPGAQSRGAPPLALVEQALRRAQHRSLL